jgi:hypothetical protein
MIEQKLTRARVVFNVWYCYSSAGLYFVGLLSCPLVVSIKPFPVCTVYTVAKTPGFSEMQQTKRYL